MDIKIEKEIKNINDILNSHFSAYYINQKWKKNIKNSLKTITKHMNKEKNITQNEVMFVVECLNVLINTSIETNMNKVLKKFLNEYIGIVKEWNDSLLQSSLIDSKISYIQRFLNDELTYSECLLVLRDSSKNLKQFDNWKPPSFRISKHYYDILKEE